MIPYQYALRRRLLMLSGGKKYRVQITGNSQYAYVKIESGSKLTEGEYFFSSGTTLILSVQKTGTGIYPVPYIKINGTTVQNSAGNYSYVLNGDCSIACSEAKSTYYYAGQIEVTETQPSHPDTVTIDVQGSHLDTQRTMVTINGTRYTASEVVTAPYGAAVVLSVSGNNTTSAPYCKIIIDGVTVAEGNSTYTYTANSDCTIVATRYDVPNLSGTNRYGIIEVTTT